MQNIDHKNLHANFCSLVPKIFSSPDDVPSYCSQQSTAPLSKIQFSFLIFFRTEVPNNVTLKSPTLVAQLCLIWLPE